MALEKVLFTGDTHGHVEERLFNIRTQMPEYEPEKTAVIILGDVGFLHYLNNTDRKHKMRASEFGYTIYCVKGNHEARPGEYLGMRLIHDNFVGGKVWIEDDFPLIRYFTDWGIYNILGRQTLVIGGAYSVDKFYRLQNGWQWFADEQLTPHEMAACMKNAKDREFDLILSHTCPASKQPVDMFLSFIDQSTVDNAMELWMDELANSVRWNLWLWGHYHADRIEASHCEMFYYEVEDLESIEARWKKYDETGKLDWWLPLSPAMEKLMKG